jgi:hypothetical protein
MQPPRKPGVVGDDTCLVDLKRAGRLSRLEHVSNLPRENSLMRHWQGTRPRGPST